MSLFFSMLPGVLYANQLYLIESFHYDKIYFVVEGYWIMGVYTIFLDVSRSADLLMEETREHWQNHKPVKSLTNLVKKKD
jgi:hypothetical protein